MKVLPWPGPGALDLDRAAVHRHEGPDQGQADPQPALRAVERALDLGEQVEDPGEHLGGDAPRPSRAPGRRTGPPRGDADTPIRPPSSVYLAALVSRLTRICSSRVGSASTRQRAGLERRPVSVCRLRVDERADRLDGAGDDLGERRARRLRSWILPRRIRETSSRSSIRCEQVADLAGDHVVGPGDLLAAGHRAGQLDGRWRWPQSGLRSSWASMARNSSLRRSSSARAQLARPRPAARAGLLAGERCRRSCFELPLGPDLLSAPARRSARGSRGVRRSWAGSRGSPPGSPGPASPRR